MKFSFVLHFDELPEELQEKKINEWIEYQSNSNSLTNEEDEPVDLDEALQSKEIRSEAKRTIEAYFPIYF